MTDHSLVATYSKDKADFVEAALAYAKAHRHSGAGYQLRLTSVEGDAVTGPVVCHAPGWVCLEIEAKLENESKKRKHFVFVNTAQAAGATIIFD